MESEIKWQDSPLGTGINTVVCGTRVVIQWRHHRHFLTIADFGLVAIDLGENLDEAKQKALQFLKEALQERIASDREALAQIEYAESGYLLDRLDQVGAGMAVLPGVWPRDRLL